MIYWISAASGLVGIIVLYIYIRKHSEKDLTNKIKLKQGEDALHRLNELRVKEQIINEGFNRDKEYLLKSGIINWPKSGRIELPKDRRQPKRITKAKV